ncbi:MAG TPA: DUF2849 domain-containing protein [Asticcacaulis sp.]|nr:DUF2849 domain-containing protein [Asticcacaulis sp.]
MKLLTANRLQDGLTLWYTDDGWVEDGARAQVLDDDRADALQKEWAARETVLIAPYVIPLTDKGNPVQREHVREFVRANGPTIGQTADAVSKAFKRADIFED